MRQKLLILLVILAGFINLNFIFAQQDQQNSQSTTQQSTNETNNQTDENNEDDLDELDDLDNLDNLDDLDEGDSWKEDTKDEDAELTSWGYKDSDQVMVKEVGPDYVVLEAPVVKASDKVIKQYRVYYSTKSLAENLDATQVDSKTFTFDNITEDKISLKVDGLNPDTTYYAVVVPVNSDDVEGEPSKEISFTTQKKEVEKKEHPAPEVSIENVSYSISWDKLTIKWSPVKGAEKIEIYSKSINDPDYKKVWEVKASSTSYTTQVTKPGEYQIKLTPVDSEGVPVGKDYILTVKINKVQKKEIKKAPKVWPETTVLFVMLILASLGYLIVRYRKI